VGTIHIDLGGNSPGGLWDLTFGSGDAMSNNGSPLALYFTDGINGEKDGLFGVISVPEPSTWGMMLLGFAGLGFLGYRRTQRATPVKPSGRHGGHVLTKSGFLVLSQLRLGPIL
jgi:hypothetical protein